MLLIQIFIIMIKILFSSELHELDKKIFCELLAFLILYLSFQERQLINLFHSIHSFQSQSSQFTVIFSFLFYVIDKCFKDLINSSSKKKQNFMRRLKAWNVISQVFNWRSNKIINQDKSAKFSQIEGKMLLCQQKGKTRLKG